MSVGEELTIDVGFWDVWKGYLEVILAEKESEKVGSGGKGRDTQGLDRSSFDYLGRVYRYWYSPFPVSRQKYLLIFLSISLLRHLHRKSALSSISLVHQLVDPPWDDSDSPIADVKQVLRLLALGLLNLFPVLLLLCCRSQVHETRKKWVDGSGSIVRGGRARRRVLFRGFERRLWRSGPCLGLGLSLSRDSCFGAGGCLGSAFVKQTIGVRCPPMTTGKASCMHPI